MIRILSFLLFFIFTLNATDKVVLQLKWLHQFQFAGYYAALEQGFYADAGLDVEIRERDLSKDNIKQVLDGEADYGVADSILILRKAKGDPVVIVAPIFQHSPQAILTLKSSGIDSPYKLQNQRLIFYRKDSDGLGVLAMLQSLNVLPQINRSKSKNDHQKLLKHYADAYTCYVTNEPFYLKEMGIDYNIINPAHYGIDFYGDMLFTSTTEAQQHPDRVKKFNEATLKGWEYALRHKNEIIALIHQKYAPKKSIAHLQFEAEALDALIRSDNTKLGTMDSGRLQYILELYSDMGLIDTPNVTQEFLFEPFQPQVDLTSEEKTWLHANPHITFTTPIDLPPFIMTNKQGDISGILAEYYYKISTILGHPITLKASQENTFHDDAKKEGSYGLAAVIDLPQHHKKYLMTQPVIRSHFEYFTRRSDAERYKSLSDLRHCKVSVLEHHRSMIEHLKQIEGIELTYAQSATEQLNQLQYGYVDVIAGYPNYHYLISQQMLSNVVGAFSSQEGFDLCIGVNPQYPHLHSILNKALATMTPQYRQSVIDAWLHKTVVQTAKLTQNEEAYLQKKQRLKMCIDPNWMPFEKNEHGTHVGMSADYFALFERAIGTPIEIVPTSSWSESLQKGKARACDLFSLVMPTKERREYLDFTVPYLKIPLVIATRDDALFIPDIANVVDKKIGIVKGYAYGEILRKRYPDMKLIEVENLDEGLNQVKRKTLFGMVDTLETVGYSIQKDYVGELKIAGKFDDQWELGIGTRNDEPLLHSIFNKAIATISPQTHREIMNKWVSINYEQGINYTLLAQWAGGVALFFSVILFLGYRINRRLKHEIKRRIEVEKQLEELSITDSLTQVHNRRHFDAVVPEAINRAKRNNEYLLLAIIDIDFFKHYNDHYGHKAGDQALIEVAKHIANFCKRANDYIFRIGGEEFALLIKGMPPEQAHQRLIHLLHSIEALHILHERSQVSPYVTLSIGATCKRADAIKSFEQLYQLSDDLLYQAKAKGRNQVVFE